MKEQVDLSIVIPVYNSESSVHILIEELNRGLEGINAEVVLVNDGSQDDSLSACEASAMDSKTPITIVDLSKNFGEHNAVFAGLDVACGRHVVIMDDDLQNSVADALSLWRECKEKNLDVVYGCFREKEHSFFRNVGSKLANQIANFLFDKPSDLYLSSFKCLNRFLLDEIKKYKGPYPYLDGLIFQVTKSVGQILVDHDQRRIGKSSYTLRKLLSLFTSVVINFSVLPLRIASVFGCFMSLAGLLFLISVLIEAIFFDTPLGWASLMSVVLLLSGVQLLILGLVGEYLGRVYITQNGKPQFIVRKKIKNH